MSLIIIGVLSYLISLGINVDLITKIAKALADNEMKFDMEAMSKLQSPNKMLKCLMYIPYVNVLYSLLMSTIAMNKIDEFALYLNTQGLVERMTPYEIERYKEAPTGLNALLLPVKIKAELDSAKKIVIPNYFKDSIVYYELDENRNIKIITIDGPASRLSKEELMNEIHREMRKQLFNTIDVNGEEKLSLDTKNLLAADLETVEYAYLIERTNILTENKINISKSVIEKYNGCLDEEEARIEFNSLSDSEKVATISMKLSAIKRAEVYYDVVGCKSIKPKTVKDVYSRYREKIATEAELDYIRECIKNLDNKFITILQAIRYFALGNLFNEEELNASVVSKKQLLEEFKYMFNDAETINIINEKLIPELSHESTLSELRKLRETVVPSEEKVYGHQKKLSN